MGRQFDLERSGLDSHYKLAQYEYDRCERGEKELGELYWSIYGMWMRKYLGDYPSEYSLWERIPAVVKLIYVRTMQECARVFGLDTTNHEAIRDWLATHDSLGIGQTSSNVTTDDGGVH